MGEEKKMEEDISRQERINRRRKKRARKNMFDILTTAVIVVALGIFLFSGYKLLSTWREYNAGTKQYDELVALFPTLPETEAQETKAAETTDSPSGESEEVTASEETTAPAEDPRDWVAFYQEMKALNPDYVGWIIIEGTQINYPIVQSSDNDYYLHRLFDGTENFSGTLFVDYRCEDNFVSGNTIVHGHNMKNGSMFAGLLKYREEWFYNSHKTFSVYTEEGEIVYEVFAIYATDPVSTSYVVDFSSDEEYVDWMNAMYAQSVVKPAVNLNADTQVLTLSTCVNNSENRLIIQARRVTP